MQEVSSREQLARQKYIAEHAPVLLGQILNGTLAGDKAADPQVCASLAVQAAGALYDQLTVSVG